MIQILFVLILLYLGGEYHSSIFSTNARTSTFKETILY